MAAVALTLVQRFLSYTQDIPVKMSFGFSVGDFIAVTKLIRDIISSLRDVGGAAYEYQELMLELEGLQRALLEVDRLRSSTDTPVVNAIKCIALSCKHPLNDFLKEVEKYKAGLACTGTSHSVSRTSTVIRKATWSLSKKEETQKLRTYLNAHVGSINILLGVEGL